MSGNSYQYNPAEMFKEWIQKSGKAQTEFMKNFSSMMNPQSQQFDPLGTLKEISNKTVEAQSNFMENLGSMQSKGRKRCTRIKGRRLGSSCNSSYRKEIKKGVKI